MNTLTLNTTHHTYSEKGLFKASSPSGPSLVHNTYKLSPNLLLLMVPCGFSKAVLTDVLALGKKEADTLWPKAAFFVSNFIERLTYVTNDDGLEPDLPVCAKVWQSLVGPKYWTRIKAGLRAAGVIELTADKNQDAGKSERYQLGHRFLYDGLRWEVVRSAALARKFRKRSEEIQKVADRLEGARRAVFDNLQHITAGHALLQALDVPQEDLSIVEQARLMLGVRALHERKFWVSYPHYGDRLYHSIACMPGAIREHLLIDGEAVNEADMSCAQPFFCLALYPANEPERALYAEAVSKGTFYEMIRDEHPPADRWNLVQGWDSGGRDSFKKEVFRRILYGGLRGKWPKTFEAFAKCFPVLAGMLGKKRWTKEGARALAAEMRCAEASLIYDRVIPRIRAEMPGCIPVSVHDAIMCQRRFADSVAQIIGDEAEKKFGVRPRVSVQGPRADGLRLAG